MYVVQAPPTPRIGPNALSESNSIPPRTADQTVELLVGEGTYTLHDDIQLGHVPSHPSEPPVQNVNVLDTKLPPPTSSIRLSCIPLPAQKGSSRLTEPVSPSTPFRGPQSPSADGEGATHYFSFGDGATGGTQPSAKEGKEALKRRKPKASISKSNPSFISRFVPLESLQKRLQEHKPEGLMVFANNNRALQWLDFSLSTKTENLTKIMFTKAHPLCHDVNTATRLATHIDLIVGLSTCDIVWYEPISQRYSRINKNGIMHNSPVTQIRWFPGSETRFLTAHLDGMIMICDKDRDDAPFEPDSDTDESPITSQGAHSLQHPRILIRKSLRSRNQKCNPAGMFRVSKQRINDAAFSPDGRFLAVVSEDGTMRIVDFLRESLIDLYSSYYGGLTCCCWSPDGRYILTGGQDDLVSVWSFQDRALVARCVGHGSWISAVAFDPWRCDEKNYRFGSVAEDRRLLLWDFSVGIIAQPRPSSIRPTSLDSRSLASVADSTGMALSSHNSLPAEFSDREQDEEDNITHAVEPRADVSTLPPVMSRKIDEHALSWLGFEETCIITACRSGHIKTWNRPETAQSVRDYSSSASALSNPFK